MAAMEAAVIGGAGLGAFAVACVTRAVIQKTIYSTMGSGFKKVGRKKLDKKMETFHVEVAELTAKTIQGQRVEDINVEDIHDRVLVKSRAFAPPKAKRDDVEDVVRLIVEEMVEASLEEHKILKDEYEGKPGAGLRAIEYKKNMALENEALRLELERMMSLSSNSSSSIEEETPSTAENENLSHEFAKAGTQDEGGLVQENDRLRQEIEDLKEVMEKTNAEDDSQEEDRRARVENERLREELERLKKTNEIVNLGGKPKKSGGQEEQLKEENEKLKAKLQELQRDNLIPNEKADKIINQVSPRPQSVSEEPQGKQGKVGKIKSKMVSSVETIKDKTYRSEKFGGAGPGSKK